LYKITFSYAGYENAFNVVNEVRVSRTTNPTSMQQGMLANDGQS
jgi:hypothetical protein